MRVLMMPEDVRKSLLKTIPDQKEKDMEIPKKESLSAATPEERITALEKKVRDMEAMVKGLTDELLDLKSIAMRLNKVNEERRAELKMSRPATPGAPSTVVVPKRSVVPQAAAPEPEKMDMIMQPDGTLKPERRQSSDYIVASASYSKKAKQTEGSGKKNDLIVAEDEEKDAQKK
jgi:hypothetical protein